MKVEIGTTTFHSITQAKETVKNLIYSIGVTTEVNNPLLYDLIKLHYDYENKTKNMVSLGIEARDKGLGLVIHNKTDTTTISWKCCFDGESTSEALLTLAFRTSIEPQIWRYKLNHFPSMCHLCDREATEADHIYEFCHIRDDFLRNYQGTIPTKFRKTPRNHSTPNRTAFLEEDPIELAFQDYHRSVATYRPLCRTCNGSRKIDKKLIYPIKIGYINGLATMD